MLREADEKLRSFLRWRKYSRTCCSESRSGSRVIVGSELPYGTEVKILVLAQTRELKILKHPATEGSGHVMVLSQRMMRQPLQRTISDRPGIARVLRSGGNLEAGVNTLKLNEGRPKSLPRSGLLEHAAQSLRHCVTRSRSVAGPHRTTWHRGQ